MEVLTNKIKPEKKK